MSKIRLSKKEQELIVSTSHHEPRSVLGFHEVKKTDGTKKWIIRVMESDAAEIFLDWENDEGQNLGKFKQIHPGGLFEIVLDPLSELTPYRLHITFKDGNKDVRYDPYYFSPTLTEYDRFLFKEGNHHQIYRKLGAHPMVSDGVSGVLFAVWAPNAKRVSVVGDFNFWDGRKHPMQVHTDSGIWELFIPDVQVGTKYKFEIRGEGGQIIIKPDPYGYAMQKRPETASIVTDLNDYNWGDSVWMEQRRKQEPLNGPINIYEVHLGSWMRRLEADEAGETFLSYRDFADKMITYVKDMGYTHIELLPLAEHPLDASWGYQVTGFYAATSRFGSPQDLMYFVDQCHQAGIGVIMDWVPGHFPKDEAGIARFDGSHLYEHMDPRIGEHKEWGTLTFNYGRHEVRNFLLANALFWLDHYHIDGIRVDAVASMLYLDYNREEGEWMPNRYGGKEHIEAIDFFRNLNSTIFNYFPGILSMAEESTAWPGVTHPTYTGGLGFNMKWNMGWMNDTLRYISSDPVYRKYDHHLMTFSIMYAFSENFVLPISHDEVVHGKRSLLDKMPGDYWQKRANLRLYLTYLFAHPGKKLLFMGSELGQWNEWSEARSLDWHLLSSPDHTAIQSYARTLNWFYRSHPALYSEDFSFSGFEWIDLHDSENSVLSFMRVDCTETPEEPIIFIFNFTPVPRYQYMIGAPKAGTYCKLLDSDKTEFHGSGYSLQEEAVTVDEEWQGKPCKLFVDLPPLGAVAFQRIHEDKESEEVA